MNTNMKKETKVEGRSEARRRTSGWEEEKKETVQKIKMKLWMKREIEVKKSR